MRIKSRIWISIMASVAVSTVLTFMVYSILRNIDDEVIRDQKCDAIINEAFALNLLIVSVREGSGLRDLEQIVNVRRTLGRMLEELTPVDPAEDSLLRQIRRNNQEFGALLDQFLVLETGIDGDLEAERKKMFACQLGTKVRLITDDTTRLMEISEARIIAAQGQAGLGILTLIVAVILTNAVISMVSGRSLVADVGRLIEGVRRMSGGDLDQRIDITGNSELADLAQAFNSMAVSLRTSHAQLGDYTRRLEQSNRELEDFAFVATHDLQEPLRKIRSFSERIEQDCGHLLTDRSRDYLGRVTNAARRMQNLIEALLEFSRAPMQQAPFRPVALTELVQEVIEDLAARISETGARIDLGELPTIEADPTQMRQLFQNILANALKYHRPEVSPEIRVASRYLEPEDGRTMCEVTIADNGIGFDERFLRKIFIPFQRLHGRNEYEGTGMGLAICRRIVERHGGKITAMSTPGSGSTFILVLPLKQDVVAADGAAAASGTGDA